MEIMKKIWKGLFILQITRFVCYSVAFVKNKKKKKNKTRNVYWQSNVFLAMVQTIEK